MHDDLLHPVRKITPMFIDHVWKVFPDIKCIDSSFERLNDGPEQKCYMLSSDSSGVNVYFYNMTGKDIIKIIDDKFESNSTNISQYCSMISLYNKLLNNINSNRFNVSVNIIDNFSDNPETTDKFKFQAIMQSHSTILITFKNNMISTSNDAIKIDEDDLLTYSLNLGQETAYDYLLNAFNRFLLQYNIVPNNIRFDNFQRHTDLIQMLKI
jgi:hypothetical protein